MGSLSEFILGHMEELLQEWEKYAREIPATKGMDSKDLRDNAEALLAAIAHDIAQPQSGEEQEEKSKGRRRFSGPDTAAEKHASGRRSAGFRLKDAVSEFRALRASVIRVWTRDVKSADQNTLYELTRFNEAMDEALTESINRYSLQADRSRELFLGVLGHDLRSPLGAVVNSAQYLLFSDGLTGNQTKAASMILRSSKRLQDMIRDLLDVARTRLGETLPIEPKPMDLTTICEETVAEALAYHPDSKIPVHTDDAILGTWDEARLRQVISNLVENAIRHGAPDQAVTLTAVRKELGVVLKVHNLGDPIPEEQSEKIFEPLSQVGSPSKKEGRSGLGLGLYITKEIIKAHRGSIEVQSSAKEGTTFTVNLPFDAAGT